jgi:hypothetical protein
VDLVTQLPRPRITPRRLATLAGGLAVLLAAVLAGPGLRPAEPPAPSASAHAVAAAPTAGPRLSMLPTLPPAGLPTDPPSGQPAVPSAAAPTGPTPKPIKVPTTRVATRVTVSDLGIDLPVMRQATPYPACGVAMYIVELDQPGAGPTGVTYLYAHAQTGSFLPLLKASLVNDGAAMLGLIVDVYTGDDLRFSYRIDEVRRHVTDMSGAFDWDGPESLWLQTSEGQGAAVPKLQVVATLVDQSAVDEAAAHPVPQPVTC